MTRALQTCMLAAATLAVAALQGCGESTKYSSQFSIEQMDPEVIRADKPPAVTLTGAGLEKADWIGFGFSDDLDDRKPIAAVTEIEVVGPGTITVTPPALPGITDRTTVWVTAGKGFEESQPAAITFRPPFMVETYFVEMAGGLCLIALSCLGWYLSRRIQRLRKRQLQLATTKANRANLRERRRERLVDAYLAQERAAKEAEYLRFTQRGD